MNPALKIRLSTMMFLQYFVAGAYTPVLSLYLKEHRCFSGVQTGMILSMTAAGAIIAPLVTSLVADRFIRAERLLGVLQIAGGALFGAFATQTAFVPVIVLYLCYTIINVPTFALTNAIVFHHSPETRHAFGAIRMWGTVGWIAVAWLFSFFWLRGGNDGVAAGRIPDALWLTALSSLVLGLYAFTLPSSSRPRTGLRGFLPAGSLRVLANPSIVRLCAFMLFASVFYRFYVFGTAPFLRAIGFPDSAIMPVMSLGQIPEIFAMGILGRLLLRHGSKKIIILGLLLDMFRYATAAAGGPPWLVIAGLSVHGLSYTFIYATASIYLDRFCDGASRAGAHQLFYMITLGIGSFAGN
ncbi:MAG: MFS transporter, partial [Chitinispirillaceae bacterium]|nr:MFS transporter [Chitinispirillaceae bacterium]